MFSSELVKNAKCSLQNYIFNFLLHYTKVSKKQLRKEKTQTLDKEKIYAPRDKYNIKTRNKIN